MVTPVRNKKIHLNRGTLCGGHLAPPSASAFSSLAITIFARSPPALMRPHPFRGVARPGAPQGGTGMRPWALPTVNLLRAAVAAVAQRVAWPAGVQDMDSQGVDCAH